MCHDNEEWCKVWRGINLSVQNWLEEFGKFWLEHSKISKLCNLMEYFLPKYIMFQLKKVQRNYVWWHWRLMHNLKENWLVLSKMTWRIWQIFVHKLKNSDFILESKMAELNQNELLSEQTSSYMHFCEVECNAKIGRNAKKFQCDTRPTNI